MALCRVLFHLLAVLQPAIVSVANPGRRANPWTVMFEKGHARPKTALRSFQQPAYDRTLSRTLVIVSNDARSQTCEVMSLCGPSERLCLRAHCLRRAFLKPKGGLLASSR